MGNPIDRTAKSALDANLINGVTSDAPKVKSNNDTLYNYVDGLNQQIGDHAGAVTLAHPDQSVTTAKIKDLNVTTIKIADGAITPAKIPNASLTFDKFVSSALTNETQNALRITEHDEQLADIAADIAAMETDKADKTEVNELAINKVDKNGSGQVTYAMLSQDAREQITGGNTAVVGTNAVLEVNVTDMAITPRKTNFFDTNLLNKCTRIPNKSIGAPSGSYILVDSATSYILLIPITLLQSVAVLGCANANVTRFLVLNGALETVSQVGTISVTNPYTSYSATGTYIAFSLPNGTDPTLYVTASEQFANYLNNTVLRGLYKRSDNLFDDTGYGKAYFGSSYVSYDSTKESTNIFPINNGDTIYFGFSLLGSQRYLVLLNADLTYNSRTNISSDVNGYFKYTNNTGNNLYGYVTCAAGYFISQTVTNPVISKGSLISWQPYWIVDDTKLPPPKSYNIVTNYKGKVFSGLGDSLTAAGSGGQYRTNIKDYLRLSTYKDCGVAGTRVSGTAANAMWQDTRINALDEGSDVVTIMAGTNDVGKGLVVNDADFSLSNYDTNNFVGAYNVLLSKIYYRFLKLASGYYSGSGISYSGVTQVTTQKNIGIVIITPPKMLTSTSTCAESALFADYVKRIAKLWGIPCVDANSEMELNDFNKSMYFADPSTDAIHFNAAAHKNLAEIIIGKLKSIEPIV